MNIRMLMVVVVCLGLSLSGVSAAHAGVMPVETDDMIKLYDAMLPHYLNGGPFRVDNVTQGKTNVITTFCMERDETIGYGKQYRAELSTIAQLGGVNSDTGDPLDPMTAYLFTNFIHGTNGGNLWSTADLQEAIWYIEEELGPTHILSIPANSLFTQAFTNNNGSLYDVRVMNLYEGRTHRQSLLTVVPEPATVVLWGICGGIGLLAVRRRKRSA